MNVAGVMLLRFIGSLPESAEAQAAYAVGYAELFSLITWTSVGLMGAAAAVAGQNLGAGLPDRSARAVHVAARIGLGVAGTIGALFLLIPEQLLGVFGLNDPIVVRLGRELLRFLSVSGLFITVALTYTGGLQGTGDTRSPLVYIADLTGAPAAWHLLHSRPHRSPSGIGSLDSHSRRAYDALPVFRSALPAGQMAPHPGVTAPAGW